MKVDRLQGSCEHVQVQKTQIKFHVIAETPSAKAQKWDKRYKLRNGIEVFQYTHPFEHFGDVVFQRYKSKSERSIIRN